VQPLHVRYARSGPYPRVLVLQVAVLTALPPCLNTTTMALCTLPMEVFVHITKFLFSDEIDILAQTMNSIITPACLSLLGDWTHKARNARRMAALFDRLVSWDDTHIEDVISSNQGGEVLGQYSPPPDDPVLRLRIYRLLDLSGTFSWLSHESPKIQTSTGSDTSLDTCNEEIESLERVLQDLGLSLDPGLKLFMSSCALQQSFRANYFTIGYDGSFKIGPVFKIISSVSVQLPGGSTTCINAYMCKIGDRYDGEFERNG
jgi:hypothetical protein